MPDEHTQPAPPTMSGYLEYKNRVAKREGWSVEREAHEAFRNNIFKPKPAIVEYQHPLELERALERNDLANAAARARLTGIKLAELQHEQPRLFHDELLFRARIVADSETLERESARRTAVVQNSTPVLNKVIATAERIQERRHEKTRDRLDRDGGRER